MTPELTADEVKTLANANEDYKKLLEFFKSLDDHASRKICHAVAEDAAKFEKGILASDFPHSHELTERGHAAVVFTTELTRLHRKILRLLGMPKAYSG